MRAALLILGALALGACAKLVGARPVSANAPTLTTFHELDAHGDRRGFLLHRPPTPHSAMPVLIALHGSSANANTVMDESGLNAIADSVGALVAYPNGTGGIPYVRLFWNFEDCCGEGHRRPDEAAMVRSLVDTLAAHFSVDRSRIGLIGFSDAATLAYELACLDAGLSAIGVVSGEVPPSCRPHPAVATVVFHGTADQNIPYDHTDQHVADWAQREGCRSVKTDTTRDVVRTTHDGCDDNAIVTLYTIVGGRHAWPGGEPSWIFAPAPTRDVDASRVFTRFVLDHPRRIP
ncbi:MAG TPA: PHB depolymerase family esterase [Gemmatimonadaceae bacterium]|jgi:polyhydroxybutyrate depolymerase